MGIKNDLTIFVVSLEQRIIFLLQTHGVVFSRMSLSRQIEPFFKVGIKVDGTTAASISLVYKKGPPLQILLELDFSEPYKELIYEF